MRKVLLTGLLLFAAASALLVTHRWTRRDDTMQILRCPYCGTDNVVAACQRCGRHFVLTGKRLAGARREREDSAINALPDAEVQPCDFCQSKDDGEEPGQQVVRGLSQRMCGECNTEMLFRHGIER